MKKPTSSADIGYGLGGFRSDVKAEEDGSYSFNPRTGAEPEEPELDLEFKITVVKLESAHPGQPWSADSIPTKSLEDLLNDGWQIDKDIVCRPFVMLFFSREKEEVKE